MNLIVNGEEHDHQGQGTLAAVLDELETDGARVATMVNDAVVGTQQRAATQLTEGDRIEILMCAAGG